MKTEELEEKWTDDDQLALEGRQFLCEHNTITSITSYRYVFPEDRRRFKLSEIKRIPTGTAVACLDCCKEFESVGLQ